MSKAIIIFFLLFFVCVLRIVPVVMIGTLNGMPFWLDFRWCVQLKKIVWADIRLSELESPPLWHSCQLNYFPLWFRQSIVRINIMATLVTLATVQRIVVIMCQLHTTILIGFDRWRVTIWPSLVCVNYIRAYGKTHFIFRFSQIHPYHVALLQFITFFGWLVANLSMNRLINSAMKISFSCSDSWRAHLAIFLNACLSLFIKSRMQKLCISEFCSRRMPTLKQE